jgi:aminoglycoside phosphotransferase (APT) family kinase protein
MDAPKDVGGAADAGSGASDSTLTASAAGSPNESHDVARGEQAAFRGPLYEVKSEHARGGLGRIMKAEDRRLGRLVAIKELLRTADDEGRRFLREVQLTARLQHPGVVPIYEAGRWPDGKPYYVMKFVDGRTLKDVLRDLKNIDERLALLPKVIAIAETMAYVHSEHVIHRDLKPSNILIGPFGETVIVDWGLAKDLNAPRPDAVVEAATRAGSDDETVEGTVLGTPSYMPPEQARGEALDERADVYSLGAVLYELFTGEAPYAAASSAEAVQRVLEGPPVALAKRVHGVARDLIAIVDKAMERDPARRYANAGELAADLTRFQTVQLVSAHEYSRSGLLARWIAQHRGQVVVALISLTLLVVAGVVSVRRIVRERDRAEARSDELILTHARSQLGNDPTAALAWAKTYPLSGPAWNEVGDLAVDAAGRGIAKHVFRHVGRPVVLGAFSRDGQRFAVEDEGNTIKIVDVQSGRALAKLHHGGDQLTDLDWMRDDRTLFVRHWRMGAPELIDVATGQVTTLSGHSRKVNVAIAPRGELAVTHDDEGLVKVWDPQTKTGRTIAGPERGIVEAITDGHTVALAGKKGSLELYDLGTGQSRVLAAHGALPRGMRFSNDGH